jgi:hypothetical protein
MIVEERMYTLQPACMQQFLTLYASEGMAIQAPILGNMVGYYYTEVGPLDMVVHMWAYKSMDDREQRRARLQADIKWTVFAKKGVPLVRTQENRILIPAPFFAERLRTMLE